MNKSLLVEQVIAHLNEKIKGATEAADVAHLAAIDDQSVAETQYDTLAIESAYLAEGQTRRIAQYKAELELMSNPKLLKDARGQVSLGSWVSLEQENGELRYVYLAPAGAGLELTIDNEIVNVITPNAPIGLAMLGLIEGDEFNLMVNQNTQTYYVLKIR